MLVFPDLFLSLRLGFRVAFPLRKMGYNSLDTVIHTIERWKMLGIMEKRRRIFAGFNWEAKQVMHDADG
jgi:hypothetical protein